MSKTEADIGRVHDAWLGYERTNTPSRVLELCAPDVRWLPPDGAAITGHDAIEAWLLENPATIQRLEITDRQIWVVGRLATLRARFETQIADGHGERQIFTGSHLWVLEVAAESRWLVQSVSWGLDAPA